MRFSILFLMLYFDRGYKKKDVHIDNKPSSLYPVKKPVRSTSSAINPNSDLLQRSNIIYLQSECVFLASFEPK